ncbi:MAG: hypothetical protein LBG52_03685 [Candidatus Peribacteria bacterium]|jgi:hypothetical protein|nr:hypothetical protein [Candidatus Peribacteria bacterium]
MVLVYFLQSIIMQTKQQLETAYKVLSYDEKLSFLINLLRDYSSINDTFGELYVTVTMLDTEVAESDLDEIFTTVIALLE